MFCMRTCACKAQVLNLGSVEHTCMSLEIRTLNCLLFALSSFSLPAPGLTPSLLLTLELIVEAISQITHTLKTLANYNILELMHANDIYLTNHI